MAQESYPEIIQDSGLGREKHPGLRLRRSGKWGVQIYHPIEGKAIWLGTYDSIEEAKNVYHKKKLEMALLHGLDKHKTPICVRGSQTCCKSYKGVRQRRSGRWSAEIRIPFKRKSVYLGTFTTPEEAADAYAKKRREFDDTMTAPGKKRKCKGGAGENSDSTKPNKNAPLVSSQDSQGSHTKNVVDANCAKGSQTCCVSYKGVRQRRSGRWSAEIKHPFNRRKSVYLGTFNNPGEAADAYAKKRREFDDALRREFDDALMALGKKQQRKGQAAENSNSTVTAVSSQHSPENKNAEDEFGVGVAVINSYGQLIGEYSRIDDDLWLTGL